MLISNDFTINNDYIYERCFHTFTYHLDLKQDYSYHRFNENKNWVDYGGGLIFGWRITKSVGIFLEGN